MRKDISEKDIDYVASIATNNDPVLGKVIADVFKAVGRDGGVRWQEDYNSDKITTEVIQGSVSAPKRTEIFRTFQNDKDPRVLVIQPQAAAHGVTLTAANTVVWWGPTSSLETYDQANARVHRSGQKHKSTVVQLQGSAAEKHVYRLLDKRINVHAELINLYKELLD